MLLLVGLGGCNSAQKAAEYSISHDFADPASARFRSMHINHEGVVCGEVDGKKADGTPTGYREFLYYSHTGHSLLEPPPVDSAQMDMAAARCRAAAGTDQVRNACEAVDTLAQAHRLLTDFQSRYTIDCH